MFTETIKNAMALLKEIVEQLHEIKSLLKERNTP